MARIVVIGAPGSGKTTLAHRLALNLGLTYVQLDAVLHGRDGIEPSNADFRKAVLPALQEDSWVVDGWHERKLGTLVLQQAEVAVFLDLPLPVILARLLQRTLPEILLRRELWNGNRQTWHKAFGGRNSLFGYALRRHADIRRRVPQLQEDRRLAHLEWVRLTNRRSVSTWVEQRAG